MAQNNADFGCTFIVRNQSNQPYDLTSASLEMQWKNTTGQAAQATFKTTDVPATLVIQSPANAGTVTLNVPFTTMQGLKSGLYYWDLLKLNSGSSRTLLGSGVLLITDGVTENATVALPKSPLLSGISSDNDIVITSGNSTLVIMLSGNGAPSIGIFAPQPIPAPPFSGFVMFCDQADGQLKVIDSFGDIGRIPLT